MVTGAAANNSIVAYPVFDRHRGFPYLVPHLRHHFPDTGTPNHPESPQPGPLAAWSVRRDDGLARPGVATLLPASIATCLCTDRWCDEQERRDGRWVQRMGRNPLRGA